MVTTVETGQAVQVPAGMTVRIEVLDPVTAQPTFASPTELPTETLGGDVTVSLPDGQMLRLAGYGETLLEQALGAGVIAPEADGTGQVLGPKVSIDYLEEDTGVSRVDLYFDKQDGLDVDALFAALEIELGLRPPSHDDAPNITGMNVVEQPLDLSDLLLQASAPLTSSEASGGLAIGETTAYGDMASLWRGEDEALAVNDNDVLITA